MIGQSVLAGGKRMFGNNGNAQAKRTSDAGGTATTLAVSRARAVQGQGMAANHIAGPKPTTYLPQIRSDIAPKSKYAAIRNPHYRADSGAKGQADLRCAGD